MKKERQTINEGKEKWKEEAGKRRSNKGRKEGWGTEAESTGEERVSGWCRPNYTIMLLTEK